MDNQTINRKRIKRSPSYPSIDLKEAIGLAKIFKEKEGGGENYAPYQAVVSHWGYTARSSPGLLKLAALKKFGLLDDKGTGENREIRLTELAKRILFYEGNSDPSAGEYWETLGMAALKPPIHQELFDKYALSENRLPSDQALKTYLVLNRPGGKFSEAAVDDFINQLKSTFSLANLIQSDNMSGSKNDKYQQSQERKMESSHSLKDTAPTSQTLIFPVKVSDKMEVSITLQDPREDSDLRAFLATLEALKPGILRSVLDKKNEE